MGRKIYKVKQKAMTSASLIEKYRKFQKVHAKKDGCFKPIIIFLFFLTQNFISTFKT